MNNLYGRLYVVRFSKGQERYTLNVCLDCVGPVMRDVGVTESELLRIDYEVECEECGKVIQLQTNEENLSD